MFCKTSVATVKILLAMPDSIVFYQEGSERLTSKCLTHIAVYTYRSNRTVDRERGYNSWAAV